jgi:hypothetical protein
MKTSLKMILGACASALLVACSSAPTEIADTKPDPRQGEQVRNVCFQQQIRNWRKLDNRAVIVEMGVKDEYKLELMGTCQPDDAFINIGLVSRGGSSCLNEGDKLVTDARYNDGSCSIRRIYKWNKDATTAQGAAPAAS